MTRKRIWLAGAVAALSLAAGAAQAGVVAGNIPAPGILGLVAMGVIGAIAIARYRK